MNLAVHLQFNTNSKAPIVLLASLHSLLPLLAPLAMTFHPDPEWDLPAAPGSPAAPSRGNPPASTHTHCWGDQWIFVT